MATIYPDTINCCNSPAEKKVLEVFRTFSNKFHIIQNFPWNSTYITKLPNRFSSEGEVDFIIFHEEYGMLILEIKGGNVSYSKHAFFRNNGGSIKDPYEQARESSHVLRNMISKFSKNIIVGDAVGFPEVKKPDFSDGRQYNTFDINDLNNLENKILTIFKYWKTSYSWKKLDFQRIKTNIKLIIEKLLPDSIDPLGQKIIFDNKKWLTLSEIQNDIINDVLKSQRYFVSGRAGTGKTILAIVLARLLAQNNEKILFLTYNVELSKMIKKEIEDNKDIESLRLHEFLRKYHTDINVPDSVNHEIIILDYMIKSIQNKYDVLIIDEAQSLGTRWLGLLNDYFKNKKIYIFSDELQSFSNEGNITNEQMSAIFKFDLQTTLSFNYRSPYKVYKRLLEVFNSSIQQTTPRKIDSLDLMEIITDNPRDSLYKTVDNLLHSGVTKEDIIILISSSSKRNIDDYKYKDVNIQTVKKYRGMEKPIVIFVLASAEKKDFNEIYVAYSRSTTQTTVIIPESVLSLGKSHFEQILLNSEITDSELKENIDNSSEVFYNNLIKNYNEESLLNYKLYYSNKYIFLPILKESFINRLLADYFNGLSIPCLVMSDKDIKSCIFYSDTSINESNMLHNYLSYDYCKKCNIETYKSHNFCLNCNLHYLSNISKDFFYDFNILNNPKKYKEEERKNIHDSLRTIGRYFYTNLNSIISTKVLKILNNQTNVEYVSCIIEILLLLYKHKNNIITIHEIRQNISVKLYKLTENWNQKTGIVVNSLYKEKILKKKDKGIYTFERLKFLTIL